MREDIKINDRAAALSDQLVAVLESVYDPEIELDIYNLGLVYEINLDDQGFCTVVMTFTDAGCSSFAADTVPVPRLQAFTANPLMVSGDIAKTVMEEMLPAHKQYLPRFF